MKKTIPLFPNDVLLCDCGSNEHQMIIRYFEDTEEVRVKNLLQREVFISVHLATHRNFFKRFWYGLKYAFGYKCKYGDWDEIVINKTNYDKLKSIIDFLDNKVDFKMNLELDN